MLKILLKQNVIVFLFFPKILTLAIDKNVIFHVIKKIQIVLLDTWPKYGHTKFQVFRPIRTNVVFFLIILNIVNGRKWVNWEKSSKCVLIIPMTVNNHYFECVGCR